MNSNKLITAAFACLLVLSAAAQAQNAGESVSALTVHLNPGTNQLFEEYVKALREAANRTNSKMAYLTSQSMTGEPTYQFNRTFTSWAEIGEPGPNLAAVYGEAEAKRLAGLLQTSIASTSTAIYTRRLDLSRPWPALDATPVAVTHINITVRPQMTAQFESFMHKVIEATAATAPNLYWLADAPGEGAKSYRLTQLANKWTDLDTPPKPVPQRLAEHFGQAEGQRLMAEAMGMIENIETVVRRTRPDLNRQVD
jgi:hypothetical protein